MPSRSFDQENHTTQRVFTQPGPKAETQWTRPELSAGLILPQQQTSLVAGGDRDFQHAISLVREKFIGLFDLFKREAVGDQRLEIDAA